MNFTLVVAQMFSTEVTVAVVIGISGALITGIVTFLVNSKKVKNDDFKAIINANERFRDELRKDLQRCKETILDLEVKIEEYERQMEAYRDRIRELESTLIEKDKIIARHEATISHLRIMGGQ